MRGIVFIHPRDDDDSTIGLQSLSRIARDGASADERFSERPMTSPNSIIEKFSQPTPRSP
jgi:hypothetical protein